MITQFTDFKVVLEGEEVPFISFNIFEKQGQPAQASVSFPAVEEFLYLLPKTKIQIYHKSDDTYLIFDGALAGQGFNKTSLNRNVTLNFTSNFMEWTRAYIENFSTNIDTNVQQKFTVFSSTNPNITVDNGLTSAIVEQPKILTGAPFLPVATFESKLQDLLGKGKSLNDAVQDLLKLIANANPYYDMISSAEKLTSRLLVADNKGGESELFNYDITKKILQQRIASTSYQTSFSDILQEICQIVFYDWVDIAAQPFGEKRLVSTILKPNTEYLLPIQCNVIFPEQITSINYTRNMDIEPTRIILSADPTDIAEPGNTSSNKLYCYFTYPDIVDISQGLSGGVNINSIINKASAGVVEGVSTIKKSMDQISKWRDEEKYRGVTAVRDNIENYLPIFMDPANSEKKDAPNKPKSEQDREDANGQPKINQENVLKQNFTMREYYNRRYHSRTASISTEYCQYRLVGFPALVLDQHLPSLYGTIDSIQTSVSAEGTASQLISIIAPKLCSEKEQKEDDIPDFESYFNHDYFGVATIGKNFYKQLCDDPDKSRTDFSIYGVLEKTTASTTIEVIREATKVFKSKFTGDYSLSALNNRSYYESVNKRKLISENDFGSLIGSGYHSYMELSLDDTGHFKIGTPIEGRPYVTERWQKVNEIVKNISARNEQ